MRILILAHAFNSLSQRLHYELLDRGHQVSVELDISDATTQEAVQMFAPDVLLAPYLKRALPRDVWSRVVCMVVHPGPPGDRGPAALDWAILDGVMQWGVTVLQADERFDAGPVWASAPVTLRAARKGSLYREEVTEAAVSAVLAAMRRLESRRGQRLTAVDAPLESRWRPWMSQAVRRIDWARDDTATVLRKVWASDGHPGVDDSLLGRHVRLFEVTEAAPLRGAPGELIARRWGSIARATVDGAVWIGQLQAVLPRTATFKRAAADVLGEQALALPNHTPQTAGEAVGCGGDLRYERRGGVGYLHFDFYNGALSSNQCERLREAYRHARSQPTRVIVLLGGRDFWCNGMHLHAIESCESPAEESWRNINAMNDLTRDILETDDQLTVAAMQGSAAAGGVFLALAADVVYARAGVTFNPHYRNMGNLFGSEYWTYSLPRRVGTSDAEQMMNSRLPFGVATASRIGLIDGFAGPAHGEFMSYIVERAEELAVPSQYAQRIAGKRQGRRRDEESRPLAEYRATELEHMRLNFFGFDPSFHVARYRFVHRTPPAWTPRYLARHRTLGRAGQVTGGAER